MLCIVLYVLCVVCVLCVLCVLDMLNELWMLSVLSVLSTFQSEMYSTHSGGYTPLNTLNRFETSTPIGEGW